METQSKEARMTLATDAIQKTPDLSLRSTARTYRVPYSTLSARMNGHTTLSEHRPVSHKFTKIEEEVLIRYILDLDSRGVAPRLAGVEDMANLLLNSRGHNPVGTRWAHQFVQRQPQLKTRFNRVYDFQRALCEDPELVGAWFRLVENLRAKYGVLDCIFYNFDETGFMMGVIWAAMVVTRADQRGRGKAVQLVKRE